MRVVRNMLLVIPLILGLPSLVSGQVILNPGERIISWGPIQSAPAPVYHSPPVVQTHSVDPVTACCGGSVTGDCKCKHLHCELKLHPPHCKKTGPTTKTPIYIKILGKIPKDEQNYDCYELIKDFNYDTLVPTILCTTTKCVEIGTKTLQCEVEGCRPGCSFTVCIPVKNCVTKTVECKLVKKPMPHKIFKRTDPNDHPKVSYDVYVINNADENSPYHAGGMPERWLVMHCATKEQVQAKFPNMLAKNQGKNVKPKATTADVGIELLVKKELVKQFVEAAKEKAAQQETVESRKTAKESDKPTVIKGKLKAETAQSPNEKVVSSKLARAKVATTKEEIDAALEAALAKLSP